MLWLSSPPYLRWAAATTIIVVSLASDLRPATTAPYPVAAVDISPGETIEESDVTWVKLPVGSLAPVELPVTARRTVAVGEPIGPWTAVDGTAPAPTGWLGVPLTVAGDPAPGTPVILVITGEAPRQIPGVVLDSIPGDGLVDSSTMVAVPPDAVGPVANAIQAMTLVVFVGS